MQDPLDDKWLQLTQDWQSQPYEKIDIPALVKQTKKRILWAKVILVLDVIATIGLWLSFIASCFDIEGWGKATVAYLGYGAIFSTIYVYYEIKFRRATWQITTTDPEHAVEVALKGIDAALNYCKMIKWSAYALFPAVNLFVIAMSEDDSDKLIHGLIFANSLIVFTWGLGQHFFKKRQQEKVQLMSKLS